MDASLRTKAWGLPCGGLRNGGYRHRLLSPPALSQYSVHRNRRLALQSPHWNKRPPGAADYGSPGHRRSTGAADPMYGDGVGQLGVHPLNEGLHLRLSGECALLPFSEVRKVEEERADENQQ